MTTSENYNKLLDWYWNQGQKRNQECKETSRPEYELPANAWAWNLYEGQRKARIAEEGLRRNKPALAIWGPSQVGKSTLLARYLDSGAESNGYGSGLHWEEDTPILFEKKVGSMDGVLTWNPYNMGADASACITCFTLEDDLEHKAYPVRIQLATHKQILHAIACGYLSECRLDEATGETVSWTMEEIEELIRQQGKNQAPQRAVFEALLPIVELLENLIEEGSDRFARLRNKSLRLSILQSAGSFSNLESVRDFAAKLFWDDTASLTTLYKDLSEKLDALGKQAKGKMILCSYEVARLLNDMAAYSRLSGGKTLDGHEIDQHQETRDQIDRISCEIKDDVFFVGMDLEKKLIQENKDFALIQGIIWELGVPLHRRCMEQSEAATPLIRLLEVSDLLDFPGIAKEGQRVDEQKLSPKGLDTQEHRHMLFSKVLKRGKTASILYSSAREARIDNLSVLVRADEHLGQAGQIYHGVKTWWNTLTDKDFRQASEKGPSLNLVFTFFAEIVNNLILNPDNPNLARAFDRFECLDKIKNPKIATIFATNYHQYSPFANSIRNEPASDEEISRAREDLLEENTVKNLFAGNLDSAKSVFEGEDGGTNYYLEKLREQAGSSNFQATFGNLHERAEETYQALLKSAAPEDGEDHAKAEAVDHWRTELDNRISQKVEESPDTDYLQRVSAAIRSLVEIEPDSLNPVPADLKNHRNANNLALRYVKVQIENWKKGKEDFPHLGELALDNGIECAKALGYLAEGVAAQDFARWLLKNFGRVRAFGKRQAARRMVAVKLSDQLLGGPDREPHLSDDQSNNWLKYYSDQNGDFQEKTTEDTIYYNPQYQSIITPFLQNLARIRDIPSSDRPRLPGDEQLLALQTELES
ncbi:MAG: hypothetical protein HOI65_18025 [Opitutae bacterium]|nr:hypothetical protein [Opitutae bacterium]